MNDLASVIAVLREKTEKTRNDFLHVEIQTCAIALDMARLGYARRHTSFADHEMENVTKGIEAVERFLPQASEEKQVELRRELARVRAELESVQREFHGKAA